MTRARAKQLLPVITAFANGEAVEFRSNQSKGEWYQMDNTPFETQDDFRVKPKSVTITREDLEKAWIQVRVTTNAPGTSRTFDEICKQLEL